MRIIISPAKKMNMDADTFPTPVLPVFLEETEVLKDWIRTLSFEEAQALWNCNGKIAELNYRRFLDMDLRRNLTPALISYEGIQYQYMAPEVFTQKEWDYVQERLRILSGFYGVLKPLDGVVPYRLEMQAKAGVNGKKNLYEFWENRLYREVHEKDGVILNLASKEYSRCIEKYLKPEDTFITCVFGEWKSGKVIQKGTQAKMARGEMVRFMAERGIEDVEEIRRFDRLGYQFQEELSSDREYIFIRSV
ncbi:MAG: peroxide stress protein YaaA [Lachnospiraceae bacterium]|nr:peroxide stress protein YaaA [Lachnospiraceae bacterium]